MLKDKALIRRRYVLHNPPELSVEGPTDLAPLTLAQHEENIRWLDQEIRILNRPRADIRKGDEAWHTTYGSYKEGTLAGEYSDTPLTLEQLQRTAVVGQGLMALYRGVKRLREAMGPGVTIRMLDDAACGKQCKYDFAVYLAHCAGMSEDRLLDDPVFSPPDYILDSTELDSYTVILEKEDGVDSEKVRPELDD